MFPVSHFLKRFARCFLEFRSEKIRNRNQTRLPNIWIGNAQDFCYFLFKEKMKTSPACAEAPSSRSEHEAPSRRCNCSPTRALHDVRFTFNSSSYAWND